VVLISLSKHKRKDFQVIIAFGHKRIYYITIAICFYEHGAEKILRNLGSMPKTSTHALSTSKAYDRVPREKICGVLREYCVDTHLLLAVVSLRSVSEVCFRVRRVK